MPTVIAVENLCKSYRLGQIGGGTLREDLSRCLAKLGRKPDPTLKVGQGQPVRQMSGEFRALQDVSFTVKEGDVLGVMGRNGAGKSTLLKILSRVTGPTSGFVKIRGRIAALLEVGTGFHPELTGRENIFLNGTILGMTKAELRRKFDQIVAFSDIEGFIDTPVKRYSSGMYVRLAFAVAAHLETEILIVDEVLAVGDARFQKKCLGKMADVSRQGRTVLFVSHNLDAIRTLCRKAIILQEGQLDFVGPVDRAVDVYLNSGSSASFGVIKFDPPMKFRKAPFFREACLMNQDGVPSMAFDVRRGLSLSLTYEVPEPIRNLEVGIRVFTSDSRPVFTSHISEALPEMLSETQQGMRVAVANIPGNFLMPGDYMITIALFESVGEVFDCQEGVLKLTVEDTGTVFTKYGHNHLMGVVLKRLEWKCSNVV